MTLNKMNLGIIIIIIIILIIIKIIIIIIIIIIIFFKKNLTLTCSDEEIAQNTISAKCLASNGLYVIPPTTLILSFTTARL